MTESLSKPAWNYVRGDDYIQNRRSTLEIFTTGIEQFDNLFANNPALEGAFSGEIIEIVGLPASGKTMLLKTIAINVLGSFDDRHIIFIDTKFDFQAIKLKKMMEARGIPEKKLVGILKKILVHRATTPDELIDTLQFIVDTPRHHENFKIIMIDSITVPFYFYFGQTIFGLRAMTTVAQLLKKLAARNVTILVTNLGYNRDGFSDPASQSSTLEANECPSSSSDAIKGGPEKQVGVKPALGAYWNNVAHHKVLIDFTDHPHDFNTDLGSIERRISLHTSINFPSTSGRLVQITDLGVA